MARNVRKLMVNGALDLISRHGVHATSFAEVTQATQTPRGSIYHHFPGGKSELVCAAISEANMRLHNVIVELPTTSATELTSAYVDAWRQVLIEHGCTSGSAPAAVAIGAEADDQLREAGEFYAHVVELLGASYVRAGVQKDQATQLAACVFAAVDGAIISARAQRSVEPFERAVAPLSTLTAALH